MPSLLVCRFNFFWFYLYYLFFCVSLGLTPTVVIPWFTAFFCFLYPGFFLGSRSFSPLCYFSCFFSLFLVAVFFSLFFRSILLLFFFVFLIFSIYLLWGSSGLFKVLFNLASGVCAAHADANRRVINDVIATVICAHCGLIRYRERYIYYFF
jgi:hypothetical protein